MNPLQRVIDTIKPICGYVSSDYNAESKVWSITFRKKLPRNKYARTPEIYSVREEDIDELMVDLLIERIVFEVGNSGGKATCESHKELLDKCSSEYEQSTKTKFKIAPPCRSEHKRLLK